MSYVGDDEPAHLMTNWQAARAREVWREEFETDLSRRRAIAGVYWREIDKDWQLAELTPSRIEYGACLRWPILVPAEKRAGLIEFLTARHFYLSDVWYDSVIAPKSWQEKSSYQKGNCPQAEKIGEEIFNLPTHRQMTEQKATRLARLVNQYLINGQ